MELFRLAKDIFHRKYHPIEYPVTLLGGVKVEDEKGLNQFLLMTTLFTYRSGFRQFARSDCSSDKGWGCLIRTCQMMVARCLTLHGELDLSWFRDMNDDACPFAIHKFIRFVQHTSEMFDAKFWTPAQGCEAIRSSLIELGSMHMLKKSLTAYVCSDSTIVVEDVQFRLDDGMSVLILLPTVTGLHRTITQGTYLCLEQLLQVPHCCGIVAGVPNRSYFIIGVTGQRFCFLDPHTTQPAFTDSSTLGVFHETAETLPAVQWNRIDSSILIGFYIHGHEEWDDFVDHLVEVKRKAGGVELFSLATKAMMRGGANARKPQAQHMYMRRKMNAPKPAATSTSAANDKQSGGSNMNSNTTSPYGSQRPEQGGTPAEGGSSRSDLAKMSGDTPPRSPATGEKVDSATASRTLPRKRTASPTAAENNGRFGSGNSTPEENSKLADNGDSHNTSGSSSGGGGGGKKRSAVKDVEAEKGYLEGSTFHVADGQRIEGSAAATTSSFGGGSGSGGGSGREGRALGGTEHSGEPAPKNPVFTKVDLSGTHRGQASRSTGGYSSWDDAECDDE